jgi:hypothetical protein
MYDACSFLLSDWVKQIILLLLLLLPSWLEARAAAW